MLKNLKNRLNENKGFSLVELIVVIAIMVILIALLVPNVVGYISKAQDSANLSAAKTIYNAANTAVVDVKAQTGAWPDATKLAAALDGSTSSANDQLAVVPAGTTAAIEYEETSGAILSVWVCTGDSVAMTGDDCKNVQAYDPQNPGNAAKTSSGGDATVPTFAVKNVDGAGWETA